MTPSCARRWSRCTRNTAIAACGSSTTTSCAPSSQSDRYTTGIYDANSGHLNPYKYTLGLGQAAARAGVRIFENSWVTKLELAARADADNLAHTESGTVRARHLLIAGNALLGRLVPALSRKLMAVGTYIAATEVLGEERARALITNNAAVADINWVLDYFRRSADHRLLFGGRVSYSGVDPFDSARVLRARIATRVPATESAHRIRLGRLRRHHAEPRAAFRTTRAERVFSAGVLRPRHGAVGHRRQTGGRGHGGIADRFDVFAQIPHRDFPGGTYFRRPALVLAMLWFRLKDLL